MITEDKVTEIFFMADEFHKFFCRLLDKYSLNAPEDTGKRTYHRAGRLSVPEVMSVSDRVLLRKRAIIESVNDELKNIAQVEHSRHRSVCNFAVNLLGAIAAYCYFPKKPTIQVARVFDNQLTLF